MDPDRWYYRREGTVLGPVAREALSERTEPDTLVCPAGSDEWCPARDVVNEDTASSAGEASEPDPDRTPPTLERFRRLCRYAPAVVLERELERHGDEYDHRERSLLQKALRRRTDGEPTGEAWWRRLLDFS